MRFNHIYVLLGLFAVVPALPLDASGGDRLIIRGVKDSGEINGVNGNWGTNIASGTNGGAHSNSEPSTHPYHSTAASYTFLGRAGGPISDGTPKAITQRVDDYLQNEGLQLSSGQIKVFTNQYSLSDLTAEFQIRVTADGQTHEYTIPRA
ncbi:hypothetical protein F5050DRAFT_309765 [Lentinula boryana]|uniref:Uncharacterized protein n=1 Tax=Lentinula boryana TaxID=40481 RepID=A0ABQ8QAA4_9AGAR|nr:hypothetical protein F5050DRAFT_309765 [Lentinula boryana]